MRAGCACTSGCSRPPPGNRQHGGRGRRVPNLDSDVAEEVAADVGAYIMGRKMFGGGDGPWDPRRGRGWWGEDPPFHVPVFVLTHHPREPLPLQGGTTFTFVTDGIESALEQARSAAGDKDVTIAGGAARGAAVPRRRPARRALSARRSGRARGGRAPARKRRRSRGSSRSRLLPPPPSPTSSTASSTSNGFVRCPAVAHAIDDRPDLFSSAHFS